MSAFAQDTPTSSAIAAERLIIWFTQGVFLLEARQTVRKVLPPSDALPATQSPLSGFWYELRAGDGSVRYRRIIYNPLLLVFEGPAENSTDSTIVRDEALLSDHVFTLLIPAPATTDVLLIFSSPLELGAQAEPATEVARFTFEPIIP